jgi:hypothetical protein
MRGHELYIRSAFRLRGVGLRQDSPLQQTAIPRPILGIIVIGTHGASKTIMHPARADLACWKATSFEVHFPLLSWVGKQVGYPIDPRHGKLFSTL